MVRFISTLLRRWAARILCLCLVGAIATGCTATDADMDGTYSSKSPSADGIGKVYYGREIANVMGYQGANWLARPSRATEERPDMAVDTLGLEKDDVVADIGAGLGYISFQMARYVTDGKVLAVDVQPEMLALLAAERDKYGVKNIETVLGTESDPNLPSESIDMAVMFDAYHEFAYPREMMAGLIKALKPGGQVVLAEYRAENPLVLIKQHHKMSQKQVKKEMEGVGLSWVKTDDRLPQQHLMFFEKSSAELTQS